MRAFRPKTVSFCFAEVGGVPVAEHMQGDRRHARSMVILKVVVPLRTPAVCWPITGNISGTGAIDGLLLLACRVPGM